MVSFSFVLYKLKNKKQRIFSSISALCSYLLVHTKKKTKKKHQNEIGDLELHNILVGYVHLRDVL